MVSEAFWPRRNTGVLGPPATVIWCGVSSVLKKVSALPAIALIFAGMKAKEAMLTSPFDAAPPLALAFTSAWPSFGNEPFSLASEMTKSCLACGRWQVKHALLLALALAFGRPSGVNTAYSQSPLRGQSAG